MDVPNEAEFFLLFQKFCPIFIFYRVFHGIAELIN